MKKIISIIIAAAIALSMSGCFNSTNSGLGGNRSNSSDLSIPTTSTDSSNASTQENTTVSSAINTSSDTSQTKDYIYTDYVASQEMISHSITNEGDGSRIIAAMKRAEAGEPIIIGAIGGSITYGSSALANYSYTSLVLKWWKKKFPQSKIKLVNAGISGTGSMIGVHRASMDLLDKKPDFVMMDFAVNDTDDELVNEAYENLTRDILNSEKHPALMLLFMCTDGGYNFQEQESLIGNHYNLPMVSYKDAVWPDIQKKELRWEDISPDFIHPNDKGHHILADLIISRLETWYRQINSDVKIDTALPKPRTKARFINASYLTNKTLQVSDLGGFQATDNAHWQLKQGWKAVEKNKPMKFEVTAKNITLVYNKTIDKKGATVKVCVDAKKEFKLESKSSYAWEAITAEQVALGDTVEKHTITIEYLSEKPKGCTGENFYLLGVLLSD